MAAVPPGSVPGLARSASGPRQDLRLSRAHWSADALLRARAHGERVIRLPVHIAARAGRRRRTTPSRLRWGTRPDPDGGWSELRPARDTALEAFGPERLMSGSDTPVCRLVSSYGRSRLRGTGSCRVVDCPARSRPERHSDRGLSASLPDASSRPTAEQPRSRATEAISWDLPSVANRLPRERRSAARESPAVIGCGRVIGGSRREEGLLGGQTPGESCV